MEQYLDLIRSTLRNGQYKPNRTGIDTISDFSQHYRIDLEEGFPLLTTKDLSGFRWNSLIREIEWYLSGEEHIRNLQEHTGIWDAWADEDGMLDTAYGRFWRRFPLAKKELQGESWPEDDHKWVNEDGETFDQLQYVIDQLKDNPQTRRMVVSAWHPANAAVSTLPPCHFSYVLNVQGDRLNCHLTQRSGDIALGIPFNIAAYAILTKLLAKQTGFTPGTFSHTIVDAHVYVGGNERGTWYSDNLAQIQNDLNYTNPVEIADTIEEQAPQEETENEDHVPNLLRQLDRTPRDRPSLTIAEEATIDNFEYEHVTLSDYDPHDSLTFAVAE